MDIKTFTLRLNKEQIALLEQKAKENGMTKNAYIRSILDYQITTEKTDTILEEIREIRKLLEKLVESK